MKISTIAKGQGGALLASMVESPTTSGDRQQRTRKIPCTPRGTVHEERGMSLRIATGRDHPIACRFRRSLRDPYGLTYNA